MLSTLAIFVATTFSASAELNPAVDVLADLACIDHARCLAGIERARRSPHAAYHAPLRRLLRSSEPVTAAAAAEALGSLGVPPSEPELHRVLRDLQQEADGPRPVVAAAAIAALGRFPFLSVRKFLGRMAADAERPPRAEAAKAALQIDAAEATQRYRAFVAATSKQEPSQFEPTLQAAHDLLTPETEKRRLPLEQLYATLSANDMRPFSTYAALHPHGELRFAAADTLEQNAVAADFQLLQRALQTEEQPMLRNRWVRALARLPQAEVIAVLSKTLKDEPDGAVRAQILASLLQRPSDSVIAELRSWPEPVSGTARRAAIEIAAASTSSASTRALVSWLTEAKANQTVRKAQLRLAELPDGRVVAPLMAALKYSPDGHGSQRLWYALRSRAHPLVVGYAIDQIDAQQDVASALGYLRSVPAQLLGRHLPRLYHHPQPEVRHTALLAGELKGDDARDALKRAIDDHPQDEFLFERYLSFPEGATQAARLSWLQSKKHHSHHAELLRSLQSALGPEVSAAAWAAVQNNPGLSTLAVPLVARQPPEEAAPILDALAGHKGIAPADRAAAVVALSRLGRRNKQRIVVHARDEELSVRRAARNALHTLEPTKYPTWDPYGRAPLVVESGILGAGLLLLAGDIADAELSPFFTASVGAVLGAATPFLLTLEEDITLGQAGAFGTYAAWGTGAGWGLAQAAGWSGANKSWAVVGGELVGVAAGAAMVADNRFGLAEVALVNTAAVETGIFAASLSALILRNEEQRLERSAGIGMLAGAAALIPLGVAGRHLNISKQPILMATTTLAGAMVGSLTPGIFMQDGLTAESAAYGAAAGQAVGFLAGLTLAQFTELDGAGALRTSAGAGLGLLTGGSAPIL